MPALTQTATQIRAALADRFPGQTFAIRSFPFDETVHVRWFDGPPKQAVERALTGLNGLNGNVLVLIRWWKPDTLRAVLATLCASYRCPVPEIDAFQSGANPLRAEVTTLYRDGDALRPMKPEHLQHIQFGLNNHNAYTPPAAPVAEQVAQEIRVIARRWVDAANGSAIEMEILDAGEGRHWLRFANIPSADVRARISTILLGTWNKWRRVWETGATLDQIMAIIPAAY